MKTGKKEEEKRRRKSGGRREVEVRGSEDQEKEAE